MYDFLIVGAGLYGATVANILNDAGYKVIVIDKRNHIGGNCYTENIHGINVHKYGAHIFHTDNEEVWNYLNRFTSFYSYIHTVKASYLGQLFTLPFCMYTFREMWGIETPDEAVGIIEGQRGPLAVKVPASNLEEQAIQMVGTEIYEKLIKHYTEKQWGRPCSQLPPFIIKRIPLRFEYDNRYFNDKYQGIPDGGYSGMIAEMLKGIDVSIGTDFNENRDYYMGIADKVIYSGSIDELYDFCYGTLDYRSLEFKERVMEKKHHQECAVINYTDEAPYTRIIEHKWFEPSCDSDVTVISEEYSKKFEKGAERFYPINDEVNNKLYSKYRKLADEDKRIEVGGRLGDYSYYDMDEVVYEAMKMAEKLIILKT